MKFKKIKYDGKKVYLEFYKTESTDEDYGELWKVENTNEPLESFKNALNIMVDSVIDICELPEAYLAGMEIRSVSFSWKENIFGATITALKELSGTNSPLTLNTPHLPSDQYNEGGEAPLLPSKAIDDLKHLMSEAERYLKGQFKQMNLFSEVA